MTEQKRVIRKDLSQIEKLELRCVHIVIKWFKSFRTTLENDRNDRFWAMCLPVILKIIDNEFLREKLQELEGKPDEINKIRNAYKKRYK